ncbi:iron-sulfur cluster assembly protein [Tsuneonella sp. YG55]|uniref:Iron-sulfur cluster assembly protein n=1 Tax=Tsuneonella litorea TaxID=2976475 RepID=A0A9X3A8L1_9SPHN|nr:iron-sulfur cluster assembly protein [Tsuneonella litorea]MCT2559576.1 iron-sulfur cluster assembly protein [Tsuneonella litorea]
MPDLAQAIRTTLDEIKDPCSLAAGTPLGLSEMGLVKDVAVGPAGEVRIDLRLTSPFCHMIGFFKAEAMRLVGGLPGVTSVELHADNGLDWSPNDIAPEARALRAARVREMESLHPD